MTNKEWMSTLTAKQFYDWMMWLIHDYGSSYDNTRLAIIAWLDEPYEAEPTQNNTSNALNALDCVEERGNKMTEYINLDTPLELKVMRGQTYKPYTSTLRELLDFNSIPYTAADVRPVVRARWQYKTITVPGGKGQTYAKWCCTACKGKAKERTNYCPNCGAMMEENL